MPELIYECEVHSIRLFIDEERKLRRFETPPGSYRGMPICKLMTKHPVQEGQVGNCLIKKVS